MIEMRQDKSWELTDSMWETVKDLIPKTTRSTDREYRRNPGGGRKPLDPRRVLAGIFFVLRTGIQWNAIPQEYGSSSAVHRYFMLWSKTGVFRKMWERGLERYDELKGIKWEWQSIDGSSVKSPMGRDKVGSKPTDRG
jgi:transposase